MSAVSTCCAPLLLRELRQEERQLDVLERVQDREQVVELEDEADRVGTATPRAAICDIVAMSRAADDDPAARRRVDARDQIQERRLARARRSHQGDVLALGNLEVDVVEDRDLDLVSAIDLFDVVDAISGSSFLLLLPLEPCLHPASEVPAGDGDQPLAALQSLRHFDLALDVAARLDRLKLRPAVDDPEDSDVPSIVASAAFGTSDPRCDSLSLRRLRVNATRADRSGRILSSASRKATLTRTVAFCRSAAGTIWRR